MIARAIIRAALVVTLLLIGVAALTPGAGSATSAPVGSCAAPHDCGHGAPVAGRSEAPAQPSCIHDAGCGGGAVLGAGTAFALVAVAVTGVALAAARPLWLVMRRRSMFVTRLVAGGLFRPPRLSF